MSESKARTGDSPAIADPLARLPRMTRGAVRLLSAAVRGYWLLAGRGRYAIGNDFVCNGLLWLGGPGRIRIGARCNAWARHEPNVLRTYSPAARIVIGDNVRLNGAGIQSATEIVIGDDCILGSCIILDTDHHSVEVDRRMPGARPLTQRIHIGRNVWVAGGAIILKGVTVGDDSVVGYGAVVVADVPAGVVVAGNPAKVVRSLYDDRKGDAG